MINDIIRSIIVFIGDNDLVSMGMVSKQFLQIILSEKQFPLTTVSGLIAEYGVDHYKNIGLPQTENFIFCKKIVDIQYIHQNRNLDVYNISKIISKQCVNNYLKYSHIYLYYVGQILCNDISKYLLENKFIEYGVLIGLIKSRDFMNIYKMMKNKPIFANYNMAKIIFETEIKYIDSFSSTIIWYDMYLQYDNGYYNMGVDLSKGTSFMCIVIGMCLANGYYSEYQKLKIHAQRRFSIYVITSNVIVACCPTISSTDYNLDEFEKNITKCAINACNNICIIDEQNICDIIINSNLYDIKKQINELSIQGLKYISLMLYNHPKLYTLVKESQNKIFLDIVIDLFGKHYVNNLYKL